VAPRHELDTQGRKRVIQALARGAIGADDPRAALEAEPCRREPAFSEPDYDDQLLSKVHYRTFNDARATRAKRKEMIQKRTMMRGSGQPFFSK